MTQDGTDGPVLGDFTGLWRLERQIEDRRAGAQGAFTGQAQFTPDGAGLRYTEEGTLSFPGMAPMQATRSYLWRVQSDEIAVFFEDGRRFHVIGAAGQDRHWCDPDTYRVRYGFADWPVWTARWQVSGPRKDYTMTSTYRRG